MGEREKEGRSGDDVVAEVHRDEDFCDDDPRHGLLVVTAMGGMDSLE